MEIKKPVENILEQTLKNMKSILDVDCVIGNPIVCEQTTIIPISKISIGFVSGGGEYEANKKNKAMFSYPFAGGSGGGCNLFPIGFLIITNDKVEFLKTETESNVDKIFDLINNFANSLK